MKKTLSKADELHLFNYFTLGLHNTFRSKDIVVFLFLNVIFALQIYMAEGLGRIFAIVMGLVLSIFWILFIKSEFVNYLRFRRRFRIIDFNNKVGDYPYPIWVEPGTDDFWIVCFRSEGISRDEWIRNKDLIENVLNCTIFQISDGDRKDEVKVKYVIGKFDFYRIRKWNDSYLCSDDSIQIGVGGEGTISFRLIETPHILIAGSTGSGKSLLLKVILYQAIAKGYRTILADFKGAVDYKKKWRNACEMITDMGDFHDILACLIKESRRRIGILEDADCANIDEYNNMEGNMRRIVLAVDEFADVMSGYDKKTKERDQAIMSMITEIARKGRAVGISLILSTQRPDAIVMPSAIKNNLRYRIAGKSDDNLSRVILDNGDASTVIPSDTSGVFLDSNGDLFKGFYFDDQAVEFSKVKK